ncbi:MAG TPA: alginate export family protein [Vicinamibacterales bacterium]|nr:alginate export family protein [Vicinamibacterales bacterium]
MPAAAQTPAPINLGNDVIAAATFRTRTYNWNWFGDTDPGDYTYQGSQLRLGLTQSKKKYDWQIEAEVPFMLGLPTTAVQASPQGQLGLGAAYYAANGNEKSPADIFLKQGYIRFKAPGGRAGQSLRIGRFEYNDGLETTPKNATLATLNRDHVSQRLLGNFGFSDVLRSLDGAQYVANGSKRNLTVVAARPTEGVFQVNGWNELKINVLYGALTGQGGADKSPSLWRVFAMDYDDYRKTDVKTDNRPAAVRAADLASINIATVGGNYLRVVSTGAGPFDLLFWGALQTGSWGALSQRAGAFAAEAGWQPAGLPALKPWIRAGYDYSSGDKDPNDTTHGTFMQMLPTARIYARTPFFNLMNNEDAFASLALRPHRRLTLRSDVHALSLAQSADLWYSGGGAFQPATFGFSSRPSNGHTDLATLYDLQADVTINPHLLLTLYGGAAHSGAVITSIFPTSNGGHLLYAEWTVRF